MTKLGTSLLGVAITAHCLLGIARVPHAVVAKRQCEIDEIRRDGWAAWTMQTARLGGAEVIEEVRRRTPEDAIVPVRGAMKGALEFAPRLLWPRLCVSDAAIGPGAASLHGRPIASFVLVHVDGVLRIDPR